ncbi:response regulator transcription factor [Rhodoferax sp.]|uniref:response regulator transcription factor n=1 Tax=Rhodoferax sp. TaxID=50421 RepID=UPI0028427370|nr:response regulator transcription factor [Rhodoferax sp.]MDR3370149.1 response regulator transcription factor [Rhodoferax sp.]
MRLILVEDDKMLGEAVQTHLNRSGFAVDWVGCGNDFSEAVRGHHYDFVVLDLGLPDCNGEVLVNQVQQQQRRVPVIVVTARGSVFDRIKLLDLGADDFLVKPYDLDELTARIRSVLRRQPSDDADAGASVHGPLCLYPLRFSATWEGKPIPLTHREFWVLEVLVRRKNQVLTRAQIEEALYGWGEEVESNAIEVYIHMLRRKICPDLIHTVRGVGYQLAPARIYDRYCTGPVGVEPSDACIECSRQS